VVGVKLLFNIVSQIPGVGEHLVKVHEIQLMAHRMEEIFSAHRIAYVIEIPLKPVKINIRQGPFISLAFLLQLKIEEDGAGFFFIGEFGVDFREPGT
jgi:hypothetical protein